MSFEVSQERQERMGKAILCWFQLLSLYLRNRWTAEPWLKRLFGIAVILAAVSVVVIGAIRFFSLRGHR